MSLTVSERMARVQPSATAAVFAKVAELRAAGRDIISLGAGEPDFDTPDFVKAAAIAAIQAGQTKYTPVDGTAELKAAIARKFQRDNGLHFEPAEILVSNGAKQCLFNYCLATLDEGDEAIVPSPCWVSYPDMAKLAGANPVIVETGIDDGFKMTPTMLAAAITKRTRALFLNSPCNPTGVSYSAAELRALGDVLADHPDVAIVADDIYEHIHWGTEPFTSFASACPELADRTITINGVSKAYAMTGWRIGYAAGPAHIIRAMKTIQGQSTTNASSVSQAAAAAALDGDTAVVQEMCAAYKQRHDFVVPALNDLPGFNCRPGDGAFYVFPDIRGAVGAIGVANDVEFVERLLAETEVACVPGTAFGAPGYMRISFACSLDSLGIAMDRINRLLAA